MLYLKLDLPEESVCYNKYGSMTSAPVPHTPLSVKSIQMDVTVTGYVSDTFFIATKLESSVRSLTTAEQFTLLRNLGFKTIPISEYPKVAGSEDTMIRTLQRYESYNPVWVDKQTEEPYALPKITIVQGIHWSIDAKRRLVMELTTPLGCFDVVDHRTPEAYQVGCQIKVTPRGQVKPLMTRPIMESIPTYCPKCNNPLVKSQMSNDLPLIMKCKAPLCQKLVLDSPDTVIETEEALVETDAIFPGQVVGENSEVQVSEEPVRDVAVESIKHTLRIINLEVDSDSINVPSGSIEFASEGEMADYILTKSKNSVTRRSRNLSKDSGIPLISVKDLEAMFSE